MFDESELTGKTNNEFQGDLNPISCGEKAENFIFRIFGKVFRTKYHRRISVKTQMTYEIVTNIIIALQLNSLAWYPNLGISNWSSYKTIWMTLSYSSYDNICASFYIMNFCFYGTSSLIGLCLVFFVFFGFFLKFDKQIPILFIMIFEKIIWILGTICFIPSVMILLMTFKYSIITSKTIEEYSAEVNSDSLDYGPAGIIIVICCFCILAPIIIFSEIFSCDIKHVNSNRNIKARACAQLDLEKKGFYVMMCIFYITFGYPNVALLQILALIYSFYLMIKDILYLPYYNIFENCIESCKMAMISLSLLIFLFGRLLDNGTIIVNFNIFLQPLTLYLVYRVIKRRYLKAKESTETPKNQYEFELKFRHLLSNSNLEEQSHVLNLFKKFSELSYFQKNKLFAIWEFNFYFYVIKDERLARVKLSKIQKNPSSLEGDIQEWKIFNWLSTNRSFVFPDINYLAYLRELNRIKAMDEELCYILIDLHSELSQRVSRIEKILHLVHKTSANISCIKKGYKNIIDKHKTTETFELYAGFLENILSNYDEADHVINRKNGISVYNQRNEDKRLEKYGKEVAIMLISCSDEFFGNILYINEKAVQILKTSLIASQELKFTYFLPAPYDSFHIKLAKNFLLKCNTTDLEGHKKLFLQDQQGYLIECNLLIKLTALHDSAYFLMSFQQKKIDHQAAIVSEEGIIKAHTELLSYYIGKEQKSLKNQNLSELVPLLNIEKMRDYEPWIIFWENRELAFIKVLKKIKSISVYLLIVAYKEEEIIKWKTGEAQEHFDMISDQDMGSEDKGKWEKEKKNAELKNLSISEMNFLHKTTDKTDTDIFTQNVDSSIMKDPIEHERQHNEDYSKQALSNKSNLNIDVAKKLLIGTKRRIRILQWVLFFVVKKT
ncbi:unnamed protein product [Blepharisma stoltei]|uniref:TmcB/TmcC TPR repeats domain-containing protein n=1 Tax=Blepharisma stoltei TaxID=1481888 RepID=A0AAU9J4Y6_9CILI|nr:unnamed protein product [Blepharisma stoltei]